MRLSILQNYILLPMLLCDTFAFCRLCVCFPLCHLCTHWVPGMCHWNCFGVSPVSASWYLFLFFLTAPWVCVVLCPGLGWLVLLCSRQPASSCLPQSFYLGSSPHLLLLHSLLNAMFKNGRAPIFSVFPAVLAHIHPQELSTFWVCNKVQATQIESPLGWRGILFQFSCIIYQK